MAIADRFVLCDGCARPLRAALTAASVTCPDCGAVVPLPPRPDVPLGGGALLDEAERLDRLRAQDGRPLTAPAGLEGLLQGGQLPAYKEREAWELYQADRRALRTGSDPAAQERLMFLTTVLANRLDDRDHRRALFETSLDAAPLHRHQQTLRGHLARGAARAGDLAAAEAWLAPCDPRSDDLDMDSDWRFSLASLALAREDWDGVLDALGASPDDVPLADRLDAVCAVFRAHAHERLGRVDVAADQLATAMASGERRAIESVAAKRPEWHLCAASLPAARQRFAARAASAASSSAGGGVGAVLLGVGALMGVMSAGMIVAGLVQWRQGTSEDAVGLVVGGVITALVAGPLLGGMGWRHLRDGRRAARIRVHGLPATATVVGARHTGTEINDVPLMELTLRVHLDDRAPYEATTRLLVPPQDTSILEAGSQLWVRVDPDDPAQVVLDGG